jgi:DNA-binding XRE family transcriptional regulator
MNKSKRLYSPSIPWRDYLDRQLANPEFRAAYDALEPEFALIRQLIDLRIKRGLSQRQLAKRARMQQPTIARLEGGQTASLKTLRRVADALDADVQVSLVPRKSGGRPALKMGDKPTARGSKRSKQK